MELSEALQKIVAPTMLLLPQQYDTRAARVMLLATGLQESRFKHIVQIRGPARGYWMFELIAIRDVMERQKRLAMDLCSQLRVPFDENAIYAALPSNHFLAAGFARLFYLTDPHALPVPIKDNADLGWHTYLRVWRPGKPHRHTWNAFWDAAIEVTSGGARHA